MGVKCPTWCEKFDLCSFCIGVNNLQIRLHKALIYRKKTLLCINYIMSVAIHLCFQNQIKFSHVCSKFSIIFCKKWKTFCLLETSSNRSCQRALAIIFLLQVWSLALVEFKAISLRQVQCYKLHNPVLLNEWCKLSYKVLSFNAIGDIFVGVVSVGFM